MGSKAAMQIPWRGYGRRHHVVLCLLILGFVTRGCQASIAEGGLLCRLFCVSSLEHGDVCAFHGRGRGQAEGMSDDAEFTRELDSKYRDI